MYGLALDVRAGLLAVFARYPEIERVMIFGSRAKGTFRDGSDIDLAVFAPAMDGGTFAALWREVDALPMVFKTDLLHWDQLGNVGLRDKILAEGKPLYPDPLDR